MPTPNKGEPRKKFLNRCVPYVINEGTTKDPKQAYAICVSLWDKSKKSRAEQIIEEMSGNLNVGKTQS